MYVNGLEMHTPELTGVVYKLVQTSYRTWEGEDDVFEGYVAMDASEIEDDEWTAVVTEEKMVPKYLPFFNNMESYTMMYDMCTQYNELLRSFTVR